MMPFLPDLFATSLFYCIHYIKNSCYFSDEDVNYRMMRKFWLICFLSICSLIFVQAQDNLRVKVFYQKSNKQNVLFVVDGENCGKQLLVDPVNLKSVNIEKNDFTYLEEKYTGKVIIETLDTVQLQFITLENLLKKYDLWVDYTCIVKVDDTFIDIAYSDYYIDENYVYRIWVQEIENRNNKVRVVSIYPKTAENISKAKEIRIRGGKNIPFCNKNQ